MDHSSSFHLRWNKHPATLLSVFDALLDNEKLTDCTISAEGQHVRAHKIILSACSPYFEELFTDSDDKHPIIILHDVKFDTVKALMDFMYRGEVDVPQEDLSGVLKLSHSLQVRGLSGSECVDNVSMQKGSRRIASAAPPETLPSQPTSVLCFNSGQNDLEEQRQSSIGCSSTVSSQAESSVTTDSISKPIKNYTKSINQSGSDQGKIQNPFEEVVTAAFDALHHFPSQRQVQPTTCNSAGGLVYSPIRALKTLLSGTDTTVSVSPYSSTCHQPVCNEMKSPSGEVASPEIEGNVIPEDILSDRSANLSAYKQEESLKTKSEILESSMEIVEDLTFDDDDDYTGGNNYHHDCNITEDGTGKVKRICGSVTNEEVFHIQGSNNHNSPSGSGHLNNTTLKATQSVLYNRYSCQTCGNSYRYSSGLSRHKNLQCGKEPQLQCPHCSYRCARSDNLKSHIIRHYQFQ